MIHFDVFKQIGFKVRDTLSVLFSIVALPIFSQYATQITVAADGSGDYTSIQSAIDATKSFPDLSITIYIRKGIYYEKVRLYPWNPNVTLQGEDKEYTIISYDDYFEKINRGRNSTFHTYTLSVEADNCIIQNISIQNTAGPVGQAIALSVEGDKVNVINCKIMGHQDALYCTGNNNRQYFQDCLIEGTTDFIFGNATAYFQNCIIKSLSNSFITAASTEKEQDYGLVLKECQLISSEDTDSVYLGRPWRSYAKTVFISCNYGDHILPEGWDDWGDPANRKTAYYAEFSDQPLTSRVNWSKKLTRNDIKKYDIEKVFRGWNPLQN